MTETEGILLRRVASWAGEQRENFINDLISIVNIPSVCEPGKDGLVFGKGCKAVVDQTLEIAMRMGLKTENDEYYSCSAILPGTEKKELGLVGHLDVVPAGDFGRFEPYHAIYRDGVVIGRGSSDNKGGVITALYTAKCIKDLEIPLEHTLRVLMGCSEEIGIEGRDIAHFLEKHDPPEFSLICDSSFPFHHGEKGILTAEIEIEKGSIIEMFQGGNASNSIPDYCEAILNIPYNKIEKQFKNCEVSILPGDRIKVSTRGVAAHAAFPEGGESAIVKLAGAILESGLVKGKDASAMKFIVDAFPDFYGSGFHIDASDDVFGKTTCIGGMIKTKNNRIVQDINIRYGKTLSFEEMKERIQKHAASSGYYADAFTNDPYKYIPLDDPVLKLLLKTCRELMGQPDMMPFVMGGGSHMRKLPNSLGYGCSPKDDEVPYGGAHGAEECVKIDSLLNCIGIYVIALLRLEDYLKNIE